MSKYVYKKSYWPSNFVMKIIIFRLTYTVNSSFGIILFIDVNLYIVKEILKKGLLSQDTEVHKIMRERIEKKPSQAMREKCCSFVYVFK